MPDVDFLSPWKHFVFGVLGVRTPNAGPGRCGEALWNYHVAPIIRLNDEHLYVFDPIVQPTPIRKESYHERLTATDDTSVEGSVTCLPITYDTHHKCFKSDQQALEAYQLQKEAETKFLAVLLDR